MLIEIHRYEKFYTVRHRERNTVGDTVTELNSASDLHEWVHTLLHIAQRQLLEEIVITREINDDAFAYVTKKSKANDIIPDEYNYPFDDSGLPYGSNETYNDEEQAAAKRRQGL